MKRKVLLWSLVVCTITIIFSSCKKDPLNNLTADESRIYVTQYDSSTNFSGFKTYSIVDSAAVITNDRLLGKIFTSYDSLVIATVKASMAARGYMLVNIKSQPDLGINVSRITNTTSVISYSDYYSYYDSFYDPYYWGYTGYGYYPPVYAYGVYQIQEGGLAIEMLDLKDATSNGDKIKTVWTALARGTGVFNSVNAASQVNAFFSQSTYLKASN